MFIEMLGSTTRAPAERNVLQWYASRASVSLRWSEENLLELARSINITSLRDGGSVLEKFVLRKHLDLCITEDAQRWFKPGPLAEVRICVSIKKGRGNGASALHSSLGFSTPGYGVLAAGVTDVFADGEALGVGEAIGVGAGFLTAVPP
jgi:hypothetical protein